MNWAKLGRGAAGVVLVLAALAYFAPHAAAQSGGLPADATLVRASPADARIMYGVAGTQVYRSSDKGWSWEPVGATPSRIRSLALARTDPQRLYAGTESAGLWRSLDGGRTWHESNDGLGAGPGIVTQVTAVAVDPEDDGIVYAATGIWLGTSHTRLTPMQIVFSLDGGSTWLPFAGLGPGNRPAVALVPIEGIPFTLLVFDDQGNSVIQQPDVQALLDVAGAEDQPAARRNAAAEALNLLVAPVPAPTAYPA